MEGESIARSLRAVAALEDVLERREMGIAAFVMGDDLAVYQRRGQVHRGDRTDERCELLGPVLARSGIDPDVVALHRHQRAVSVEFDLVHPAIPSWHGIDERGQLRRTEDGNLAATLGFRLGHSGGFPVRRRSSSDFRH